MGLDSYWYHDEWTDEDGNVDAEQVPYPKDISLIGGMLSGHGDGSFRGKSYNTFIENVTGVSLYQHEIDSETVMRMAEELERASWEDVQDRVGAAPRDEEEFEDLRTMFRFYADRGAILCGWW